MAGTRPLALALLLAVALTALYWPAAGYPFVALDDLELIGQPAVRAGLSGQGVLWALRNVNRFWIPLTDISFMADVSLLGEGPRSHHVTNILLHAANCALLFLLLLRMTGAAARSFLAAALVGFHPLRVESVVWIAERKDVLSSLFALLALAAYLGWVRTRRRALFLSLLLCFLAGLLAKPLLVILPVLLLLLDWWPLGRVGAGAGWSPRVVGRLLLEKLPLFLLSLAFGLLTLVMNVREGLIHPWTGGVSLGSRLETFFSSYILYLVNTLRPADLRLGFISAEAPAHPGVLAASALGFAAITWAALRGARRAPHLAVGWLWFVVSLLLVSGALPNGRQMRLADHYTYLPHWGALVAAVWGVAHARPWGKRARVAGTALGVALAVLLAVATRQQMAWWRDGVSLFTRSVAYSPGEPFARLLLADSIRVTGRIEESLPHFEAAIAGDPGNHRGHYLYGLALQGLGRDADAAREYGAALRIRPGDPDALLQLGEVLDRLGRRPEAIGLLQEYLRAAREPGDVAVGEFSLGTVFDHAGRKEEAVASYRRALRLEPLWQDARFNLAVALVDLGRLQEAVPEYLEALRLKPADLQALINLAEVYRLANRPADALRVFRQAAAQAPGSAEGAFAAGRALELEGKPEEAARMYRESAGRPAVTGASPHAPVRMPEGLRGSGGVR
jgi:tetratricopeptide (TPR) repeat protein